MSDEVNIRAYVAHLRQDHPEHCAVRGYDRQQEALRNALAIMEAVQWNGSMRPGDRYCPYCAGIASLGHDSGCGLADVILEIRAVLENG